VLAGQPALAQTLSSPQLVQLRQRIAITKTLTALDFGETNGYIEHRLKLAGYHGQPLFTPAALNDIAEASNGIPREINTICFNALLLLTAAGGKQIDSDIVHEVVSDLQRTGFSTEVGDERSGERSDKVVLDANVCAAPWTVCREDTDSIPYKSFYHFKKSPFEVSLNPAFLCFTLAHSAALTTLYSAVIRQERIMGLIGAPGTGKSLVAACVSDMLKSHDIPATFAVAKYLPPGIFKCKHSAPNFLTRAKVLFVDDAQDLSRNAWRELLTDFLGLNPSRQVVLIGRPQLEQVLQQDELRELRGQIGVHRYQLRALEEPETAKYIAWRIKVAADSSQPGPVFTEEAVAAVAFYARGIPAVINFICEGALIRGCELEQRTISAEIVHEVANQGSRGEERPQRVQSSQGEVSEVLNAAQALVELHAVLKSVHPEDRRRRCDGGKRYRDSVRKSDSAH
jgi:type II secretory pathway predicted ATPase ExeA